MHKDIEKIKEYAPESKEKYIEGVSKIKGTNVGVRRVVAVIEGSKQGRQVINSMIQRGVIK